MAGWRPRCKAKGVRHKGVGSARSSLLTCNGEGKQTARSHFYPFQLKAVLGKFKLCHGQRLVSHPSTMVPPTGRAPVKWPSNFTGQAEPAGPQRFLLCRRRPQTAADRSLTPVRWFHLRGGQRPQGARRPAAGTRTSLDALVLHGRLFQFLVLLTPCRANSLDDDEGRQLRLCAQSRKRVDK